MYRIKKIPTPVRNIPKIVLCLIKDIKKYVFMYILTILHKKFGHASILHSPLPLGVAVVVNTQWQEYCQHAVGAKSIFSAKRIFSHFFNVN
jgi:hypothetical protein